MTLAGLPGEAITFLVLVVPCALFALGLPVLPAGGRFHRRGLEHAHDVSGVEGLVVELDGLSKG